MEALYLPYLQIDLSVGQTISSPLMVSGARGMVIVGTHILVVCRSGETLTTPAAVRISISAFTDLTRFYIT